MKYNIVNTETGLKDGAYGSEDLAMKVKAHLMRRYRNLAWEVMPVADHEYPRDNEFHAIPENAEKLRRANGDHEIDCKRRQADRPPS